MKNFITPNTKNFTKDPRTRRREKLKFPNDENIEESSPLSYSVTSCVSIFIKWLFYLH